MKMRGSIPKKAGNVNAFEREGERLFLNEEDKLAAFVEKKPGLVVRRAEWRKTPTGLRRGP